jgi:hypothetical protein
MRNEGVTKTAGQGQARQKRNIWVVKKTKKPKKNFGVVKSLSLWTESLRNQLLGFPIPKVQILLPFLTTFLNRCSLGNCF